MNGACLAYQPDNPIAWPYDVPSTWSGEGWLDLSSSGRDLPFFWKGEELPRLYREANRFWLPTPNGGWGLAGVMVETVDDFGALDDLLADASERVALWFSSSTFQKTQRIRHAMAVGMVAVLRASEIVELSPLKLFPHLRALYLQDARVTDLDELGRLHDLDALFFDRLERWPSPEPLGRIPGLRHAGMRTGEYPNLGPLGQLQSLASLALHEDTSDTELAALVCGCRRLRRLVCWGAYKLRTLAPLAEMAHVEALEVSGTHVEDFSPLEALTRLESLDLSDSVELRVLAPLLRMRRLTRLELSGCTKLTDFAALQHMPQLTSLSLPETVTEDNIHLIATACPRLERLDVGTPIGFNKAGGPESDGTAVGALKRLRVLRAWRPMRNIGALANLTTLEIAHLVLPRDCRSLSFLESLDSMRELAIHVGETVVDASALRQLRELHTLSVAFGPFDAGVLAPLGKLVSLSIGYCTDLDNIDALAQLPNLMIVSLGD